MELKDIYNTNRKKFWNNIDDNNWNDWHWQLKNKTDKPEDLKRFLNNEKIKEIGKVDSLFNFGITPHFLSLINFNNQSDPLLKQVIPDLKELNDKKLKIDPFNEKNNSPVSGVVKRYENRIIITVSNICPSYCRYCTRKWMWDKNFSLTKNNINNIINYIKKTGSINEVILSGGEPFILTEEIIDELLNRIFKIKHVEVVRIGTRILTFLPQRIDKNIISVITKYKPIWVLTHFNHPSEISEQTKTAVDKLLSSGAAICNQSVLLKDINDKADVLKKLFFDLVKLRIKPYYLFQCDPVKGSRHFHVNINKGLKLMKEIKKDLSGLCIPQFVRDTKKKGKIILNSNCV